MKGTENKFYYFLAFITLYTMLLIWYQLYIMDYEDSFFLSGSPYYSAASLGPYRYVVFFFQVALSFPLGVVSWVNHQPLNLIYYFVGCLFYSLFFYTVYKSKLSGLLWVMVLLNVLAAIFLFAYAVENNTFLPERETPEKTLSWNKTSPVR